MMVGKSQSKDKLSSKINVFHLSHGIKKHSLDKDVFIRDNYRKSFLQLLHLKVCESFP